MKELKFKNILKEVALLSKDRNTQVGAIALDDNNNIVSTGYNGFPRGVNDDIEERRQRPEKYRWTSHAEENLVAQAAYMGKSLKGCTILVSSLFACESCARMIIQSGIKKIIAPQIDEGNWKDSNSVAVTMFKEAGVEVVFSEELSKSQLFNGSSAKSPKPSNTKINAVKYTLVAATVVYILLAVLGLLDLNGVQVPFALSKQTLVVAYILNSAVLVISVLLLSRLHDKEKQIANPRT